ncbi:hypothetical protein GLGCALEP_04192 [Pseudomonas sp. MM221]|nr:hypothetical protein DBADOPDK_04084 [Pseudomonas sp. MM223]CAI3806861.1 hypothetical protein GLGCALEP_04192 [Pseudomonas sp. MM221]
MPLTPSCRLLAGALLGYCAQNAHALQLVADDRNTLNLDVQLAASWLYSDHNYVAGPQKAGHSQWQEAYIRYGLSGEHRLDHSDSSVYGAFNLASYGTFGDGDAALYSDGSERQTALDKAYLGWRSGSLFPALGQNGLDLSFGSQKVPLGDGFIINGDGTMMGDSFAGGLFDRGGTYYLSARNAFHRTLVARIGGSKGWRSDLLWLKSDNPFRSKMELGAATLEHVDAGTTVGLTAVKVLGIEERFAVNAAQRDRDDLRTWSLRGKTDAGITPLFLSGEYAWQDKRSGNESAWYGEAGWTFYQAPWQPYVSARHTRYSANYDSLFSGWNRGPGTWQQGSTATNFAGPFKRNAAIDMLNLALTPHPTVKLGVQYFRFRSLDKALGDYSGQELDLYLNWNVSRNLMLFPMLSAYKPEHSAAEGGLQLGDDNLSLFTQLTLYYNF